MARKKNSSLVGASVFDCDVDAPTFKHVAANGIGDTALIFDQATGENGETNVITHEGAGTGCPLGLPLVNQRVGRSLNLTTPVGKDDHGGYGQTIIAPYALFLPPGEHTLLVDLFISNAAPESQIVPHCRLLDTSGSVLQDIAMTYVSFTETITCLTCTFRDVTPDNLIVQPTIDTEELGAAGAGGVVDFGVLEQVIIRVVERGSTAGTDFATDTEVGRIGVQTPGAAEGLFHRNFDTALFANEDALSSYELAGWNQNLNALDEYITGRPAGGGPTYTHVDHDGGGSPDAINPARVRFEGHTQALYANEGEVNLPILCESFGSFLASGFFIVEDAEPPTYGMLDHYPLWPKVEAATVLRQARVTFPDFQTTDPRLRCFVLLGSDGTVALDDFWEFTASTSAGAAPFTAVPQSLAGSGDTLWFLEITDIPFTPDTDDTITLTSERTTGTKSSISEIAILSWCWTFQP